MNRKELSIDRLKNALAPLKESWAVYQSDLDAIMRNIVAELPCVVNFTDYNKIDISFFHWIEKDLHVIIE